MWLSEYIQKALGFTFAYFRALGRSAFDLVHDNAVTKSQFGRFYWVSLFVCAFSFFYFFKEAKQYDGVSDEFPDCFPGGVLPFFSFFILAEIASFVLLLGARLTGWGMVRIWTANSLVLDQNLQPKTSELTAAQRAHVIARRVYGQMWGWFPITLALAVYLSKKQLGAVVGQCDSHHPLASFDFLTALLYPGLAIAFVAVAFVNWCMFRWKLNARSGFILAVIFSSYVAAAGIAGPTNHVLARGFLAMPQQINSLSTALFGAKIFN